MSAESSLPPAPHEARAESPAIDAGNRCIKCGYNLTGLVHNTCPECGWAIDWELAGRGEEALREGTPAQRSRGWRKIDQTALTTLVMLFMPWRFARQLRVDEAIWPSLGVAVVSFLVLFLPSIGDGHTLARDAACYLPGVLAVILCQSLCFATLGRAPSPKAPRWGARFRLWLMVSLYSTCFVAGWRVTGEAPAATPFSTNFYWPLDPGSLSQAESGVTIIFYWWWAILAVVLVIRNRPKWLAYLSIPLVFLLSCVGFLVVSSIGIPPSLHW